MSLTAILFLGVFVSCLLLAFYKHPIFGLYSYLWVFYNHPPGRWWYGDVPDWRWSLIAGLVTLMAVISRMPSSAGPSWYTNWGARFLIIFVAWLWIQSGWAVNRVFHLEGAILFTKYLLLYYLIYRISSNEVTFERFSWAHIIGCGIFGWVGYTSELTGRLERVGGPGIEDANALAAHLITGIAFAGFMLLGLRGIKRWLPLALLPFMLNGIILTQSRGALIGLIGAGMAAWWLTPRATRAVFYIVGLMGILLFISLTHDIFWDRMTTIPISTESEIEGSASSRIEIIKINWEMFKDYPLGAGHRGNEILSSRYMPTYLLSSSGARSAHNTIMAVLVDHGFPGAFLFIALHVWVAISLLRLKLLDKLSLPLPLATYRAMVGTAFASLLITGLFINLTKAEVGIWLIALLAALNNLCNDATRVEIGLKKS